MFMLLLPLTETFDDEQVANHIRSLAINIVTASSKARKKKLGNQTRITLVNQITAWHNELKQTLLTSLTKNFYQYVMLAQCYCYYLEKISTTEPNFLEMKLAKIVGINLHANQTEEKTSLLQFQELFAKQNLSSEQPMPGASASAAHFPTPGSSPR